MTVAVRRTRVHQLITDDPTLSARNIAAQVGVSKDTVLRDLDAIRQAQSQTALKPTADEPETAPDAPDAAAGDATGNRLVLIIDEPLRQALAVLRAKVGAPDTPKQNEAAARAAIRALADTVLEAQQYARDR
ncbi:hypothetical protein M878_30600 [Streptomyces roseochromogenus subsp. oscitans DS 12.976]|uniref:Uncharacterized protein n=2 Tax=Streptomyces roseochromogenus TaxID=285450 RepID=V6JZ05_STRRC|nr:hypothetical protein M878_30600 [Streptomyces roseochromogenus subsp. oscitans DS 12.976]